MDISLMIEGQMGLDWPRWKMIARAAEDLGFAGLFRSDHFVNPRGPDQSSLEMVTSLTWLASNTTRIHFGPLVAPASFRDPIMLARQAAAIDGLAPGRLWLGLGMGWMEREHTMFDYDLGDIPERSARLAEALEVITLLRSGEPANFDGRFYRLVDATIAPRPSLEMTLLLGGNGPRRTLPLVARYANVWNAIALTPEGFRERNAALDDLLVAGGRRPGDVKRTMMLSAHAEDLADQIAALDEAGCQEVMLQWLTLDDRDGLEALARATQG